MEHLLTLENGAALLTLTIMEIVLGIDNLVFIAILAAKLPESKQDKARKLGLLLAMVMRIALLFSISFLMGLATNLFTIAGNGISGRDIVLILGGGFLIWKAVHEIHDKIEGSHQTIRRPREASATPGSGVQPSVGEGDGPAATGDSRAPVGAGSAHGVVAAGFAAVLTQIMLMDMIFSLDSVITAVGMVKQESVDAPTWVPMTVMITAIMISIAVMIAFSGPISRFIEKHPTTKMLALSFLLLIGVMLAADGLDMHVPRGYIYSAIGFSIFVELLNQRAGARRRPPAPAGAG